MTGIIECFVYKVCTDMMNVKNLKIGYFLKEYHQKKVHVNL